MKVCMVVPNPLVKGGIASVVNGYRGSRLERDCDINYIESYRDGTKLAKLLKGIRGYFQFAKVLLIQKPDVVHIHSSFGPSFYRKLPFIYMASWAKLPIINHIHGAEFDVFYEKADKRKKRLIKKVYGKCNKIIALSSEWKEKLKMVVPEDRITIIENYSIVHEDAFQEKMSRPCNNQILFLGELGHRKGCFDIPSVIERVAMVIPKVIFVLCGTGRESDEHALKELVKEKGIEANVVFPGWVRTERKDMVLRNADVFFLPSYNEGMPMSVLDAMGYGLPVVSTYVGGIPKIVRDGENGFCCEPGDIDGFAKELCHLLSDDTWRRKASKKSIDIIEDEYSLKKHIDRLEALYYEVVYD